MILSYRARGRSGPGGLGHGDRWYRQAVALAGDAGDHLRVVSCLVDLGQMASERGLFDDAEALVPQGPRCHRAARRPGGSGAELSPPRRPGPPAGRPRQRGGVAAHLVHLSETLDDSSIHADVPGTPRQVVHRKERPYEAMVLLMRAVTGAGPTVDTGWLWYTIARLAEEAGPDAPGAAWREVTGRRLPPAVRARLRVAHLRLRWPWRPLGEATAAVRRVWRAHLVAGRCRSAGANRA